MLRLRAFRPTNDKIVKIELHPTHPWLVTADASDHVSVWNWEHRQVRFLSFCKKKKSPFVSFYSLKSKSNSILTGYLWAQSRRRGRAPLSWCETREACWRRIGTQRKTYRSHAWRQVNWINSIHSCCIFCLFVCSFSEWLHVLLFHIHQVLSRSIFMMMMCAFGNYGVTALLQRRLPPPSINSPRLLTLRLRPRKEGIF